MNTSLCDYNYSILSRICNSSVCGILFTGGLMYLYSFSRFFGGDKIVSFGGTANIGDLLLISGEYFLCLGNTVAWGCDYEMKIVDYHIAESNLFSSSTIEFLHRFVYTYYTSYKNSVGLFFSDSIEKLLQRKLARKKQKVSYLNVRNDENIENKKNGQSLLLFPNLWMLYAHMKPRIEKNNIGVVSSSHTEKQKNELFWGVKEGTISTIACTHAGLFQDWHNLNNIFVFSPHARYYKNRQDPRYDAITVCEKLGELYKVDIQHVL